MPIRLPTQDPDSYRQVDKIARLFYAQVKWDIDRFPKHETHNKILYKLKAIHAITPLDLNQMVIDTRSPTRKGILWEDIDNMLNVFNPDTGELNGHLDEGEDKSNTYISHYDVEDGAYKNRRPIGRPKIMSLAVFKLKYQPSPQLLKLEDTENETNRRYVRNHFWTLQRNPRVNPKMDKLYIKPGIDTGTENVVGYIRTQVPWHDHTERYKWERTNGE